MMETNWLNKFHIIYDQNRSCDWITELTSGSVSLHTIWNVLLIILKYLSQSLPSKWFGIITSQSCLARLHSQTSGIRAQDNMGAFVIEFRLHALMHKQFIMMGERKSHRLSLVAATFYYFIDSLRQFHRKWRCCSHRMESFIHVSVQFATLDGIIWLICFTNEALLVSCIMVCVRNDSSHCLNWRGPAGPAQGVVPRGTRRSGPERTDSVDENVQKQSLLKAQADTANDVTQ